MTTTDYPVARKILAMNLFIIAVVCFVKVCSHGKSGFSLYNLSLITGIIPVLFYLATGWITYLKPFSLSMNRDQVILFYGATLFTSVAIIKWVVFWYLNINPRLLPVKYENWNSIFDMVSIAIAGSGAYLPLLIKRNTAQQDQ